MRRVVVTGLGLITPLGIGITTLNVSGGSLLMSAGVRRTWKRLVDGNCGITSIKDRNAQFALLPSQVAALVPVGSKDHGQWNPKEYLSPGVRHVSVMSSARLKSPG